MMPNPDWYMDEEPMTRIEGDGFGVFSNGDLKAVVQDEAVGKMLIDAIDVLHNIAFSGDEFGDTAREFIESHKGLFS